MLVRIKEIATKLTGILLTKFSFPETTRLSWSFIEENKRFYERDSGNKIDMD